MCKIASILMTSFEHVPPNIFRLWLFSDAVNSYIKKKSKSACSAYFASMTISLAIFHFEIYIIFTKLLLH